MYNQNEQKKIDFQKIIYCNFEIQRSIIHKWLMSFHPDTTLFMFFSSTEIPEFSFTINDYHLSQTFGS